MSYWAAELIPSLEAKTFRVYCIRKQYNSVARAWPRAHPSMLRPHYQVVSNRSLCLVTLHATTSRMTFLKR